MKLFEHEGKELLRRHGIAVPPARLVEHADDAEAATRALGSAVVVKAQVLAGGRGKAGGIIAAAGADEARKAAGRLLGSKLVGHPVKSVLIEQQLSLARELYLAITIDSQRGQPMLLLSAAGGVDIEELAEDGGRLGSLPIYVLEGLQPYAVRHLAKEFGLPPELRGPLGELAARLYRAFCNADATLAEINPLGVSAEGALVALDSKIEIDEYAEPRQAAWDPETHAGDETETEALARKASLTYVELDGTIGVAGNGAGLMMLTVDLVQALGGKAANFCDAGGARARPGSGEGAISWWSSVVRIVLHNPKVKVLLFNLHGGNHRGDEVAQGLIRGLAESERRLPMVVRLSGTRQDEGRAILASAGIESHDTLEEVALAAVKLAGEAGSAREPRA